LIPTLVQKLELGFGSYEGERMHLRYNDVLSMIMSHLITMIEFH